jgi:hypothetical protein
MPPTRSLVSEHYALLITLILLNSEIINPCSCYMKKGLVCIALIFPSKYQPSSCLECTKVNT